MRQTLERDCEAVNIAVDVRRNDFAGPPPSRSEFGKKLALTWYVEAVTHLLDGLHGVPVAVRVVSDADETSLAPLLRLPQVCFAASSPLDDLATLMLADVVVASVSSSSLAARLGDAAYLWYEPQLAAHGSWLSLWGHARAQSRPGSPTLASLGGPREPARVFASADGPVQPELISAAIRRLETRAAAAELVRYGTVRRPPSIATTTGFPDG